MSLWEFCLIPFCGDQGQKDGFLGMCLGPESVEACREFLLLGERDFGLVLTILHLAARPAVPEVFQRCDEPGLRRVHPRQFVNEYHFLPFRQRFQIARKLKECQDPVFLNIQSPRT